MSRLSTILPAALIMLLLPPAPSGAAVLTFPGCGPSIQACVNDAPTGSTIELRTNALVEIPADDDGLQIKKALTIEAGPGFDPKLGRSSDPGYISVQVSPSTGRTVAFRGITFKQVSTYVEIGGSASGHKIIFENNKVINDAGTNGALGLGAYYSAPAEGSVTIRNNNVSSAGTAIEASASGGPILITGNRVTSPVFEDSQGGIFVFASGEGRVKGTIASNLVHDVSGCGCGTPAAIQARAFDQVTFDLRILNNTVSPAPVDTPSAGQAYGVIIVDPYSDPDARIDAALYNNIVANAHSGIVLHEDEQLHVTGDRNNTYNTANGDNLGSYDLGTTEHEDPLFVSETNFRLQETSPMRETGRSCMPSIPLPRGDVARDFRLEGFNVDIGAYEFGSEMSARAPGRNITDGNGSHTIEGTPGVDVICGEGGNDLINAKGSRDFAFGGGGDDEVKGASGNDFLFVVDGVESNDAARGGPGSDKCFYDSGDVKVSCTAPSG